MAEVAIQSEVEASGSNLGCRSMTRRLRSRHGISIGRDIVLQLQRLIDPEGVEERKSHTLIRRHYHNKGPNFLIHVDGYDKIKRYGFAIHGAICGFSRRLLWLKVARTNNNPRVIASYYLDFVEETKGVPRCIRMDAGTENGYIATMQEAFRWQHEDECSGEKSVIIGSSHSNQRIERWWRTLRQMGVSFWMDFLRGLDSQGIFSTTNHLHVEILRFCFMQIIQSELDQIKTEWNSHRIRIGNNDGSPCGVPDIIFFHPELFDALDYKYPVSIADVQILKTFCEPLTAHHGCTNEVRDWCPDLMATHGRGQPNTVDGALDLLLWLLHQI